MHLGRHSEKSFTMEKIIYEKAGLTTKSQNNFRDCNPLP